MKLKRRMRRREEEEDEEDADADKPLEVPRDEFLRKWKLKPTVYVEVII